MVRLVIVITIAIVIVIAGLIFFIVGPPKGSEDEGSVSLPSATETEVVLVSINAIPWARVFIKLPENDYFMEPRAPHFTVSSEPNGRDSNVTPIPGDLKVPIGTEIKLMYRGREKIFSYEEWKDGKAISHDFLNQ